MRSLRSGPLWANSSLFGAKLLSFLRRDPATSLVNSVRTDDGLTWTRQAGNAGCDEAGDRGCQRDQVVPRLEAEADNNSLAARSNPLIGCRSDLDRT
jgi:hypothetical protein